MNCSARRELLYDRLYGLLEAGDAAEMDRHVASCPDCRAEMESLRSRDLLLDLWTPEYRAIRPIRVAAAGRRVRGWLWVAAAFLITTGTAIYFPAGGSYEITGGSVIETARQRRLVPGDPLTAGSRLDAAGETSIRLGRAGRLVLESGTEIVFRRGGRDLDHEIELAQGTVHVEVFPTGRAFRVLVGERTVEVRGTRFTVRRLGEKELAPVLAEESMKRWSLGSVSVALVTVTSGTVVLSGPEGRQTLGAGRSALASPAGVEKVEAGESLETIRKYRDELLRALAAHEEKNRSALAELDALKSKHRKGELPPGATLESLLEGLREAARIADPEGIREAVVRLGLLLAKEEAAFDGILKTLLNTKDPQFAGLLCSALWEDGGGRLLARRAAVLQLFLAPDLPVDVRGAVVQGLSAALNAAGRVSEAEAATLLRAAQALGGASDDLRPHREQADVAPLGSLGRIPAISELRAGGPPAPPGSAGILRPRPPPEGFGSGGGTSARRPPGTLRRSGGGGPAFRPAPLLV
jgi:hypothetical protein